MWVRRRPPENLGAVPSGEERKAVMGASRKGRPRESCNKIHGGPSVRAHLGEAQALEADVDAVTDSPENVGHERSVRVVAEGVLPRRQVQGGLHWAEVCGRQGLGDP